MKTLLQVHDLRVGFGDHDVVRGISFDLALGEKLALVGESGSGKSVSALGLVKLVEGAKVSGRALWTPLAADVNTNGGGDPAKAIPPVDLLTLSPRELVPVRGQDIAFVFQEPMTALNPLYTVGDQIAEVLEVKRGMNRPEAWQEVIRLLQDTGIPEPERRARSYPHQLSGGQRQRVLIAMALACRPRLLIADEPTTALDVSLRAQILELLDSLQQRYGMAVLLITHDLSMVRRFADRVLVMAQGVLVEEGSTGDVLARPQHPYTQQLLHSQPQRDVAPAALDVPVRLEARDVSVRYAIKRKGWRGWLGHDHFTAVDGVSFALRAGQTLCLMGESGSGKSTLALAALGLLPSQGDWQIGGQTWTGRSRQDLPLRRQVQVVFQDPFAALSPRMTVQELVEEGLRLHQPQLDEAQRLQRILATLAEVGLTESAFPGLLQRYPHAFSGGQRQRLALARALVLAPQVLVLDEPTSALDVSTQRQVLGLLQQLQRKHGLSYLLITHDVAVIQAMAHQVMVMREGRVVESGVAAQILANPVHPYTQALVAAAGLAMEKVA